MNLLNLNELSIFDSQESSEPLGVVSNPLHPGHYLKQGYMEPLGITVTELAKRLGVSVASVSRLVSAKSELSYEMAIRLSKVFDRTPEGWMNIQMLYGLNEAKLNLELP
jgi:addiction module HigA family antidote